MVISITFVRNLHAVFHSGCTNLHSHSQCKRVPFSSHPLQQLLIISILMSMRGYLTVTLICISLIVMLSIFYVLVEHLYVLFGKDLFRFSAHFLIRLFGFLMLSFMNSLNIVPINPLSDILFTNDFSHSVADLFFLR